ncbi:MAG: tRNA (adenosine(37)-N6)-threonylcarbamoyltransferase complex ATPase subunit type 1 TsaE [Planctomycetota bacterium]|nr:tRNA (adenosine(37)-N6)-threonylcarbamoyltransferase complex ATPase subunit type 1 TsaE [Planctomycetota bacterium]
MTTGDAAATREAARRLGELCAGGEAILLAGDLGAGKTCFAQGLAQGLGVDAAVAVTSPTFTLHAEYPGRLTFNHADLYRLRAAGELDAVGVPELLYAPGAVLAVEWPGLLLEQAGGEALLVELEHAGGDGRRLTIRAAGTGHRKLAAAWLARVADGAGSGV